MNEQRDYLSDEELFKLISEVENEGTVPAPEYIETNVYRALRQRSYRQKVVEYYKFCIRVGVSVAASIAVLIATPFLTEQQPQSRDEVLARYETKSKDEVVNRYDFDDLVEDIIKQYRED